MTRRASALILLLGLAAPPQPLTSQAPAERRALALLRDSLAFARDTTSLFALEQREIEVARTRRDDPMPHLRLGLIAMRLGELRGRRHWDDAYGEFEWAAELAPTWPWPWLGIGLVAGRAPNKAEGFAGGLYAMIGEDRHRIAGEAFAKAVAADPSFTEALREYAITAREATIEAPLTEALAALRVGMTSPLSWEGELLLERGRLERLVGSPDSAITAFRRALQFGMRPGVAWLELARTYPLVAADTMEVTEDGERPSVGAYFAGAVSEDPAVVAMYRRDLEPIIDDSLLIVLDTLYGAPRVAWLREFWRNRDALDLRPAGARLAEHFRRWQVARQEFRVPPFRRRYALGLEIYRSGDQELDDRGIIYLRHGDPASRIVWPGMRRANTTVSLNTTYGSETWHYRRPDGDFVLHFLAREDQSDYRAVQSIFDLDVDRTDLEIRASEVPGLSRLLFSGPYSQLALRDLERNRGRQSIAVATQSDSWERQFAQLLPSRVQWYATGEAGGEPLVHLVYAVDAAALRGLPGDERIPITLRGGFFDPSGAAVATVDTVQYVRRPAPGVQQVALRAVVRVPPGQHRVRVGVDVTPQVGAIFPTDSLRVADVQGDSLELSAVLLGMRGQGLAWAATRADTAWIDPFPAYSPTDTVTVYAEVYGYRPETEYTVRVSVTRQRSTLSKLLGRGKDAISLAVRSDLADGKHRLRRNVALGGLSPGSYILELQVEGGGMKTVRRTGMVVRD
jgi:tetratricopeptide (TPR) repeat protein